jgi:hypothetical protein
MRKLTNSGSQSPLCGHGEIGSSRYISAMNVDTAFNQYFRNGKTTGACAEVHRRNTVHITAIDLPTQLQDHRDSLSLTTRDRKSEVVSNRFYPEL